MSGHTETYAPAKPSALRRPLKWSVMIAFGRHCFCNIAGRVRSGKR